jgi:methionine sulfoxide reductase heme-binding subunit
VKNISAGEDAFFISSHPESGDERLMIWPWQDGNRGFSGLKAATFALMFLPGVWLVEQVATGGFGPVPLGGMTYWSGFWATAILLLALAVTPAAAIFRWRRLLIVRRMVGVTALAYAIAHVIIYFALRFWDFAFVAREMATRLSLIVATVSTVGLIALGATSVDAAVRWMGAAAWQRLHQAVYATTALAILHYLLSPGLFPDQFLLSGLFFWLMMWRLLERRRRGADVWALVALAVASSLFTAAFQVACIWAFRDYALQEIFDIYFTSVLGIPPIWTVLGLGLLAAATAAVRRALPFGTARLDVRRAG